MHTVILSGKLGKKFGRKWSLDIHTPAEALRAIDANRPGFFTHLIESANDGIGYQIVLDKEPIDLPTVRMPFSEREVLRVVPVVMGAGSDSKNYGLVIVGAALVAASMYFGVDATVPYLGLSYGTVGMVGMSLMFTGISGLLAKPVDMKDSLESSERKPSYLFNGPINTMAQGGCVAVGYGELIVGSQVISASVTTNDIPV